MVMACMDGYICCVHLATFVWDSRIVGVVVWGVVSCLLFLYTVV